MNNHEVYSMDKFRGNLNDVAQTLHALGHIKYTDMFFPNKVGLALTVFKKYVFLLKKNV